MWRKEDGKLQSPSENSANPSNPTLGVRPMTNNPKDGLGGTQNASKVVGCVSQGIKIKGELTGTEDLFIDGNVEGKISLANSVVTVGPNATVKADITAREVVVRGRVEGKLHGSERIQIWHTAKINGDMRSERISIEEGSELHGQMEAGKLSSSAAEAFVTGSKKPESKVKEASSGGGKASSGAAVAGAD
jgi:cytoskeletal protein CcmA (bactofilin family)